MNKTKILNTLATAITGIALIGYAAYLLACKYPDVLITAQDRNVFTNDTMFFQHEVSRPFGIFEYAGAYLTQYFYTPAVGATILIAIWIAIVFTCIKAFRLRGMWRSLAVIPTACLLASELDLGYWVYVLAIPGYWFSQSVAILCTMLLLWAAHSTPRRYRLAWYFVIGCILFPVFGWTSYLFSLCLALSQLSTNDSKTRPTWIDLLGIIITLLAPVIYHGSLYDSISTHDVCYAGFPLFRTTTDTSLRPTIPFFFLVASIVVASLGRILPTVTKIPAGLAYMVVGIASSAAVWITIFKDSNYIYEIQMTQATMTDDWQGVIRVAEKAHHPSRCMVMLKNIALLNTGELGNRSFELGNDGIEIYNPDSLNLNLMHIAAPLILFNHGQVNYAIRWCIEFAVPYGFSPFYLKTLSRCAVATGEKDVEKRYVSRLHKTLNYSDWKPAAITPVVKELQNICPDTLDNDENSCERYILTRFSANHHKEGRYYNELNLTYSLITRATTNYWLSLYNYMAQHQNTTLPKHYLEAYCIFSSLSPMQFPFKIDIPDDMRQRYQQFLADGQNYAKYGMTKEAVSEAMTAQWGDTYWWFNAFGRQQY